MSIKDTILGGVGLLKHYLGVANKEKVSNLDLEKRFELCDKCPRKQNIPFSICGVCKCPLAQKLPLLYNPVETEQQGQLVKNTCPIGQW